MITAVRYAETFLLPILTNLFSFMLGVFIGKTRWGS